ncbi:zf-HC2 domain-containing protein [Corynebacterium pseudodiphtheriticum]|nr:zf-HC2 domain-containing protein [Corynebacterium pseudodiphtheriticum]RUP96190.1 zf-HC2 domain-containing protein [Corynebacterium pseudodiphtheriticum]RUQ00996.1 zf-HC2 domain-containing protein [Corynebacterium pseudodiphtheriticum]RUQ48423.1 zf-HC2 domain-containing protein [Corynebacterium pseudodiphtheriticum]
MANLSIHEGGESIFIMTPAESGPEKKKRVAKPRRRFDHLGPEAITAFVDGEMTRKSEHNARVHLVLCESCRADVHRQRRAAQALRSCNGDQQVQVPESLLHRLRGIADVSNDSQSDDARCEKTQSDLLRRLEKLGRTVLRNRSD